MKINHTYVCIHIENNNLDVCVCLLNIFKTSLENLLENEATCQNCYLPLEGIVCSLFFQTFLNIFWNLLRKLCDNFATFYERNTLFVYLMSKNKQKPIFHLKLSGCTLIEILFLVFALES